ALDEQPLTGGVPARAAQRAQYGQVLVAENGMLHGQSGTRRYAPSFAEVAIEAYARSAADTGRSRSTGVYGRSRFSCATRRASRMSGVTANSIDRAGMSMTISSPVSTSAISPPAAPSGDTCPMESPDVPPENLPSVTSAQARPRPRPLRNEVGYSISCMPGPPRGPSYRITTPSPSTP